MRNYKASKRPILRKSAKTDDTLTIFFQNINAVLENEMIINSIYLFQGLSQGLHFKGSYLGSSVIGFSLDSSVIGSALGS